MRFAQSILRLGLTLGSTFVTAVPVDQQALLFVTNQCPENVYVVYSNNQFHAAQKTLGNGQGFQVTLSGLGYSVGFSTDPNFYSSTVAKLIYGYSVNSDNGLIYYSLVNDEGDPFPGQLWSLTSSNSQCTPVHNPNGATYACANSSTFFVTLCG